MKTTLTKPALMKGCFSRKAIISVDGVNFYSDAPWHPSDVKKINDAANAIVTPQLDTIDAQKSKVIGLLHDLSQDAGDNLLRSGEYMTDRLSVIIAEAGKWPEKPI